MRKAWARGARHGRSSDRKPTFKNYPFAIPIAIGSMLAPTPSALSLRLQGFRSAADEPAQHRVDYSAQRSPLPSAIHIAVAAEPCDLQGADGLRSFSAVNAQAPLSC